MNVSFITAKLLDSMDGQTNKQNGELRIVIINIIKDSYNTNIHCVMLYIKDFRVIAIPLGIGYGSHCIFLKEHTDK
jgi:hypothetical protein